jgi:GDP-mannose 6-dehydrogenase
MKEIQSLSPPLRPVIAIRSTVPPGTAEVCQQIVGDLASVCSNPEFMREGHAVDDFLKPPYILVGCQDAEASQALGELYEPVEAELVCTGVRDAEAIKYVNNSWHAVKVVFANEIGAIAKAWQADTKTVMDLFCRDKRLNLSAAYLRPGAPFGGSCLPKDLRALAYAATRHGLHTPLLGSVMTANDAHLIRCLELVKRQEARRVAWLGLTFKDNTDDLRESPALKLFEELIAAGEEVFAYDPLLSPKHLLGANLKVYEELNRTYGQRLCSDLDACLEAADLAVLYTRDSAVTERVLALPESVTVVDLVNEAPRSKRRNTFGVCWS